MMVNAGVVSNTNAEMPCGGFKIHSWQIVTEYYRFGTVLKSIYTEIWNSISNRAHGLASGVILIFKSGVELSQFFWLFKFQLKYPKIFAALRAALT